MSAMATLVIDDRKIHETDRRDGHLKKTRQRLDRETELKITKCPPRYAMGYRPETDMKIKGHPSMMDQLEYLEKAYGYQKIREASQPEAGESDSGLLGGERFLDTFTGQIED